jgi:hypothetical protein
VVARTKTPLPVPDRTFCTCVTRMLLVRVFPDRPGYDTRSLARLRSFLQGVAVLMVTASAVVLTGCAANQQTASTGMSPQEEQDRAVCLQHAHRDVGYNEKAFASCMTAKGYKRDNLYPSETTADAESPPISDTLKDTLKKMAQSFSPDSNNAARQPDGENAEQNSH